MNYWAKRKIKLTHPTLLLSEHYYRRLWLAAGNVKIGRREWLDELADTFRDFDGEITDAFGQVYDFPLVDDVFGDDPDMRWMGYYLKPDINGNCPHARSRKVERLQLLDLYFRLKHPKVAQHFDR